MELQQVMAGIPHEWLLGGDDAAKDINAVVIDSRKVQPGSLYICIRGLRVDGHRFIDSAAAAGAAAIVVDEVPEDAAQSVYPSGPAIIKVSHSRKVLSAIAANFYGNPSQSFRLAGVTGTNGKTSTTYFLETILQAAGRITGVIGTVGTRVGNGTRSEPVDIPFETITTPDPLELQQIFACMRDKNAEDVVMEVSSHALSLHKVEGMSFEVGVFTNLTQDHLDFHGTMDNYLTAKSRLFSLCKYGVINADDESAAYLVQHSPCHFLTYGIQNECDLQAIHIEYLPDGSSFDIDIDGAAVHFHLPVKGRFNIYNCLAAIGAALVLNVPLEAIRRGVAAVSGVPGRIQSIPNDRGVHILVDFAHSPDGLVNVINTVREFTNGRVVTLFGCGGDKDTGKRPIMGRIAGELSDYCILTSDNPRSEPPEAIIRQIEEGIAETNCPYEKHVSRKEAIYAGVRMLAEGDALIIAGKGHEDYQIIGDQTLPFDDVEMAKRALNEA